MSKMQKLNLIIAFFIMLVFVSCGKDDEPYNPIIGTWEYTDTYEAVSIKFNKNHNFSIDMVEYYDNSEYYIKGKYEIYDKDKIILNYTDVSLVVDPDFEYGYDIVTFKIYTDNIGKYIIFDNQTDIRYYKK